MVGISPTKVRLQLTVKEFGMIWFPLTLNQGVALKARCTASPFDQGTETLVHKSVIKAYQIDAVLYTKMPFFWLSHLWAFVLVGGDNLILCPPYQKVGGFIIFTGKFVTLLT